MEGSASGHANFATEILAKHWHIHEPPTPTHLGVSRATWRVGPHYWLSQAEEARATEVFRQTKLVFDLDRYLRSHDLSISVPQPIASDRGNIVEVDGRYAWSLSRNISGIHVDVADPAIYTALAGELARFHHALRMFSRHQPMNVADGICVRTRQSIARLSQRPFVPFTPDPEEEQVLWQASAWLLSRLDRLERLPRQLVHGDWTLQNVLFSGTDRPNRLTGVLDFEAIAIDPIVVDVANICSTLLMWSGLDNLDERVDSVLTSYGASSGDHLELADVHTAMLAHWLCHYWSWRDRLQFGEFGREVKQRLCLRIRSAFSYVSRGNPNSP
ncbi:MAG: phosphotransferase enzyme family protein [Acidobacteriaceae bacterium]